MRYKDIFLDFDGTLSSSHEGIYASLDYAFDAIGYPRPVELYPRFIGPATDLAMMELLGFTKSQADQGYTYFKEFADTKGIYMIRPFDGVKEMLKELTLAEKRIFIVTGRRCSLAGKCTEIAGISEYITGVYGLDRARGINTKQLLLKDTVSRLDKVDRAVMIGDRSDDIMAGHECGMHTIFVSYGYGTSVDIEASKPDDIIGSVAELKAELLK